MNNDERIWQYLKDKGLNDYACAGIEGNLFCESGNRPNNLQNSYEKILNMTDEEYTKKVDSGEYSNFVHDSAGYGLAQWTFWSRKQGLLEYIRGRDLSIADLYGQLDYMWIEMSRNGTLMSALMSAKSVYEASTIVMVIYEAPADQSDKAKQRRADIAQQFYDAYVGKDVDTVTYSNSPLATDHVDLTKNSNPRDAYYSDTKKCYNPTGAITKIIIHHFAGVMGARQCAEMHARGNVASANYYIGKDAEVCLGVDESRRAWTTSDRDVDSNGITIETSNSQTGEPWPVSDAVYEKLIQLVADICKRNNIKRVNFTNDKSGNLMMHKWYAATACPGTYLSQRFGDIASRVNAILDNQPEPTPEPTPDPDPELTTLYCVQVGAFKNKANAEKLCKELESKGYKPFVVEKQVKL